MKGRCRISCNLQEPQNVTPKQSDERLAQARLFRWKKCLCLSLQITMHQGILNKREITECKLYFILNFKMKTKSYKASSEVLKANDHHHHQYQ